MTSRSIASYEIWSSCLRNGLRALVLALGKELAAHALADSRGNHFFQGAALLLTGLRFLLPSTMLLRCETAVSFALDEEDGAELRECVAQAVIASSAHSVCGLSTLLLGSLLLLIGCAHPQGELLRPATAGALLPRIARSLHIAGVKGLSVRVSVLARLLPCMGITFCSGMAARQLMDTTLNSNASLTLVLPPLLLVVATPDLANELIRAGLFARLSACVPRGSAYRQRYCMSGEPLSEQTAWCLILSIAASALKGATALSSRNAVDQALELMRRDSECLHASVARATNFEALYEQYCALNLIRQVSRILGDQVGAHVELVELIRPALVSTSEMLMQSKDELQRMVPPLSRRERALASQPRLGAEVPKWEQQPYVGSVAQLHAPTGETVYCACLVSILQRSLCIALGAISSSGILVRLHWSQLDEPTLLAAMRAALRSFCQHQPMRRFRGRLNGRLICMHGWQFIGAAQMCLDVYAAVAFKEATTQLAGMDKAMARAIAQNRAESGGSDVAQAQTELLSLLVLELQRLPTALLAWAETAMDAEGVDDTRTRKVVLAPLADAQAAAHKGIAAAKVVSGTWTQDCA